MLLNVEKDLEYIDFLKKIGQLTVCFCISIWGFKKLICSLLCFSRFLDDFLGLIFRHAGLTNFICPQFCELGIDFHSELVGYFLIFLNHCKCLELKWLRIV
jgi:hypothetical protein